MQLSELTYSIKLSQLYAHLV